MAVEVDRLRGVMAAAISAAVALCAIAGRGMTAGSASFCFTEDRGHKLIAGGGEAFETMWSECDADSVYAYRDYVRLIGVSDALTDFPDSVEAFLDLDWERRASSVQVGKGVVFMNEAGNFACVIVREVKAKSRGADEDRLSFDYRIYRNRNRVAQKICWQHWRNRLDYAVEGKDCGSADFRYANNNGGFLVFGASRQMFETMWSGCGADSVYAYRDKVDAVGLGQDWSDFPVDGSAFADLDWTQRAVVVKEGRFVVFRNREGEFLCVRVKDVKAKSRGDDEDLLSFDYRVYPARTAAPGRGR